MLALRRSTIALVRNRNSLFRRSTMATMSTIATSGQKDISEGGLVEEVIRSKLTDRFQPAQLEIMNDSWQHRHHAPMRAAGGGNGETHFTVHIVSEEFQGKNTMQRHRMIYAELKDELSAGLHALSLKTRTLAEMVESESAPVSQTVACSGLSETESVAP